MSISHIIQVGNILFERNPYHSRLKFCRRVFVTMTWFARAPRTDLPPTILPFATGTISLPESAAAMGGPLATSWSLLILLLSSFLSVSLALKEKVPCIENGKFYRNPNRHPDYVWSQTECAKYYLCIEDEVRLVQRGKKNQNYNGVPAKP